LERTIADLLPKFSKLINSVITVTILARSVMQLFLMRLNMQQSGVALSSINGIELFGGGVRVPKFAHHTAQCSRSPA